MLSFRDDDSSNATAAWHNRFLGRFVLFHLDWIGVGLYLCCRTNKKQDFKIF